MYVSFPSIVEEVFVESAYSRLSKMYFSTLENNCFKVSNNLFLSKYYYEIDPKCFNLRIENLRLIKDQKIMLLIWSSQVSTTSYWMDKVGLIFWAIPAINFQQTSINLFFFKEAFLKSKSISYPRSKVMKWRSFYDTVLANAWSLTWTPSVETAEQNTSCQNLSLS